MPYISLDNDLKIYYETYGDEKSYPIVLIHPLGGNIKIWEEEIRLILRAGNYRIISYEIRGHYRSSMGKKDNYTMDDLANDLDKLLDELKIEKCHKRILNTNPRRQARRFRFNKISHYKGNGGSSRL